MGWNNFVVCPKLKVMFKISRRLDKDWDIKEYADLFNKCENIEFSNPNTTFSQLSVKNVRNLLICEDVCKELDAEKMLYYLMSFYDKDTYIISEVDDEGMQKVKDFKVLEKG